MKLLPQIICAATMLAACGAQNERKQAPARQDVACGPQSSCLDETRTSLLFPEKFFTELDIRVSSSTLFAGGIESATGCSLASKLGKDQLNFELFGLQTTNNYIGLGDSVACMLEIQVDKLKGWQFAVVASEVEFSSNIQKGRRANVSISQTFDETFSLVFEEEIFGPKITQQSNQQFLDQSEWIWSDCRSRQILKINIEAEIAPIELPEGPDAWELALLEKQANPMVNGSIQLGSSLGRAKPFLNLRWRKCL